MEILPASGHPELSRCRSCPAPGCRDLLLFQSLLQLPVLPFRQPFSPCERIDEALLDDLKKNHDKVITLEDGILDGGFGEKIARCYGSSDVKVWCYGLKKEFIDRYSVEDVLKANHLTPEQIYDDIF